jgi:hypothetical protein
MCCRAMKWCGSTCGYFRCIRVLFDLVARLSRTYAQRDRVMAHYAPVALVALPVVWLAS